MIGCYGIIIILSNKSCKGLLGLGVTGFKQFECRLIAFDLCDWR